MTTSAYHMERISNINAKIASAAEEQNSVAKEINRNVVNISQVADKSLQGAEQIVRASEDVKPPSRSIKRNHNRITN